MDKLFTDQIASDSSSIEYYSKSIARLVNLGPRFDGVDLSDVRSFRCYSSEITFNLKDDAKASRLPHKLAQHFGIKFTKKQSYDKSSLTYTGILDDDGNGGGFKVVVSGAVPQTCTVEYIEEAIPENEIVRTRKKAVINCVQKELDSEEVI